LKDEDLLPLTT